LDLVRLRPLILLHLEILFVHGDDLMAGEEEENKNIREEEEKQEKIEEEERNLEPLTGNTVNHSSTL
jgi:hypothetical protein